MIRVNIHEAKTQLSRYLAMVAKGESIIICNRNVPVAEIRPLPPRRTAKRPIGLAKGAFEISPRFFEPLSDEEIDAFEGAVK